MRDENGISVDLDALAQLTATQRHLVDRLGECASVLADGGLCHWAHDGPARRAADSAADCMRDLAARIRGAGIAVDAVAADLARATRAFGDADTAGAEAVGRWSR